MKTFVYFPKDNSNRKELQKMVSHVHADAVLRKIQDTKCSKQQKELLIEAVKL